MPQIKWEPGAAGEKLEQLFRKILMVDEPDLARITKDELGERWSSLRHVDLIVNVQSVFGFRFSYNEVLEIRSYLELRNAVFKHLG